MIVRVLLLAAALILTGHAPADVTTGRGAAGASTNSKMIGDVPVTPPAPRYSIVTAYTSRDHCAPDDPGVRFCDGLTASMNPPVPGVTLACPPHLPLGTVVWLEGVGERVCHDRGGAIRGQRFDLYVEDRDRALAWGRRTVEYEVVR